MHLRAGRWARAFVLLLLLPALSGCSIKLAYDNADRLLLWRADDYVDLDRDQKAWLRARLQRFMHWHRVEQLPEWASTLREFDLALADGVTPADMDRFYGRATDWGEDIVVRLVPTAAELLPTLSDAQVADMAPRLAKANEELNEDYAGLPPADQRAVWRRKIRDELDDWIGALTPQQDAIVETASRQVVPDNAAWIAYRARWQAQLLKLLAERHAPGFERALLDLSTDRERFYTPEYAEVRANNDKVYRRLTLDLLTSLTPAQSRRLSGRLDDIATDFEELVAAAGPQPPDPGPPPAAAAAGG